MKNKVLIIVGILFLFVLLIDSNLLAQCPMCKIAAESNLKNGGTAGRSLNAGIFIMLFAPYIIVGTIGYIWVKNRKKNYDKHNGIETNFSDN